MKRRRALLAAAAVALAAGAAAVLLAAAARERERVLEDFAAFDGGESGSAARSGAVIGETRRNR